MRSIWVFSGRGRLAVKTPIYDYWIFLDFLGFSRPNRDFSMGYAGFSQEDFASRSVRDVTGVTTAGLALGMRKGVVAHGLELTVVSDFLQVIVVRPFLVERRNQKQLGLWSNPVSALIGPRRLHWIILEADIERGGL
jgi:hypothetical protein